VSENITTRLLQTISDKHKPTPLLVLLPVLQKRDPTDMSIAGAYSPMDSFVNNHATHILEDGESFIEQARNIIKQQPSWHYLIVTPLMASRFLSDELRKSYPGHNLEQIVFKLSWGS